MDSKTVNVMRYCRRGEKAGPVQGKWSVPKSRKGIVWYDASSIAMGGSVEIDGIVFEDAARLRKRNDYNHINMTVGCHDKGC